MFIALSFRPNNQFHLWCQLKCDPGISTSLFLWLIGCVEMKVSADNPSSLNLGIQALNCGERQCGAVAFSTAVINSLLRCEENLELAEVPQTHTLGSGFYQKRHVTITFLL